LHNILAAETAVPVYDDPLMLQPNY